MTHTIIISGASRGLGLALAQHLASSSVRLITISRNGNSDLAALCHQKKCQLDHINADLARAQGAETACLQLKELLQNDRSHSFWLINNAGMVEPIAQAHQLDNANSIAHALQLNIGSLINLCASFLAHTPDTVDRRILNISSGAGRNPIAGWGVYGATKAAVDYFSQTLALEQPELRVVSLAPGVIDTDMQATIRSANESHFPNIERFIGLHQNQQLASAAYTAEQIARYLANDEFGNKTLDDIRHYF